MANQILASFTIQVKAVRLYSVPRGGYLIGMPVQFFRDPTNPHDHYCVEVFLCGRKLGHVARTSLMEISLLLQRVRTMLQGKQSKREYVYTGTCACAINQPVECSQVRKQCTIILQWINMQSVCCSLHCLTAVLCRHHIQVIQRGTGVGDTVSLMCVSKSERGPWSMLPSVKKELKGAHQKLTRLEVSLSLLIKLLQVR